MNKHNIKHGKISRELYRGNDAGEKEAGKAFNSKGRFKESVCLPALLGGRRAPGGGESVGEKATQSTENHIG